MGGRFTEGRLYIGVDVGSTTVKCVVVDPATLDMVWSRYERHETRQAEKVAEMLVDIEAAFADVPPRDMRVFITGSAPDFEISTRRAHRRGSERRRDAPPRSSASCPSMSIFMMSGISSQNNSSAVRAGTSMTPVVSPLVATWFMVS